MFQVDDRTLRYAKAHFSPEFRREVEMAAEVHGVSEEAVMRERLQARFTGEPIRYSISPQDRLRVVVDNTQ